MYRFFSFFVIFTFVSSVLYLHQQNSHYRASSHIETHHDQPIVIPNSHQVPSITGSVTQDRSGTWLLKIQTSNFSFTPEKVGIEEIHYDEGHAHLYINGEKINRIYGKYYNLDYLEPGENHIKVTLNGNDHRVFSYQGKEIAFSQTIKVP